MDCPDLQFHSQMADWNVVSYATYYESVVAEPEKVVTRDGIGIPEDMRGAVFTKINGKTRYLLDPADRDLLSGLREGKRVAVLVDPESGEAGRDESGRLILLDAPRDKKKPAGFDRMVGWRTPSGVTLQHGGSIPRMLDALQGIFPEVNVIRLDFNAATVMNEKRAENWAQFADQAAARGYRLIIQNSDGELAGGFVKGGRSGKEVVPRTQLGPVDALDDPDGDWKINDVRDDWETMLQWFRDPAHERIFSAVAGWELINEPMAYGNKPKEAALYSRHIADLIYSLDWGDKRLFVGGMRASAQFADLDHDLIRQAAGDKLVWSAHMYPGWVTAAYPQSSGETFTKQICGRIGTLDQPGDDIIVTESQLYSSAGSLDPATSGKRAHTSFNMARKLPWFADQGIGWTWWPPTGRNSDLLKWQGARKGWHVQIESAAFAHWGWTRDNSTPPEEGEHWGSGEADRMVVDPRASASVDGLVGGVNNPHGLAYGLGGDDDLQGHDGIDMLYGGAGNDTLNGGPGDDWLFGGRGDDGLDGGDGNDVLIDPEGGNHLTGGTGDDHLEGSGTLEGGPGADVLIASYDGEDLLVGGDGSDRFLPDMRGQVTIRDFIPGEDRLDLSMISGTKPCKIGLRLIAGGEDAELSWDGATIHLPGAGQLTRRDLAQAGACRLQIRN
ncbi:calcium-binding protein [Paracoccus methylarcula]|uniref:calcium-binding protein n=1 Tax=Paracoccus methylarcula TaxID=72022 RepID=UPI000D10F804|nr:calcium-binding protein [Paracoccus methylarcula]